MTAACHSCRELIGGYVLDALDPAERELVRRHIETCEPCAREHAELATLPALLDVADSADAVPLRPPPRLEEAVLDSFARERRERRGPSTAPDPQHEAAPVSTRERPRARWTLRPRWLAPALAAAACALAALVAAIALNGSGDDREGPGATAQRARVYRVAMNGAGPTPQAAGVARLYPGDTGTGVHLEVSGLRPDAYDYELWCVRDDGWKISAGTFRVNAAGEAEVSLTTAAKPTEYDGLTIQARPKRGARQVRPARVLEGRIRS